MGWKLLRRSGTPIDLSYGGTFASLIGTDFEVRTDLYFELRFKLEGNLRAAKSSNRYADARELADGAIRELKTIQLGDSQLISKISEHLRRTVAQSPTWIITIVLANREHHYHATPQTSPPGLLLTIIDLLGRT
jgi:hypothetical protein